MVLKLAQAGLADWKTTGRRAGKLPFADSTADFRLPIFSVFVMLGTPILDAKSSPLP
jgi:hypothetical protein